MVRRRPNGELRKKPAKLGNSRAGGRTPDDPQQNSKIQVRTREGRCVKREYPVNIPVWFPRLYIQRCRKEGNHDTHETMLVRIMHLVRRRPNGEPRKKPAKLGNSRAGGRTPDDPPANSKIRVRTREGTKMAPARSAGAIFFGIIYWLSKILIVFN